MSDTVTKEVQEKKESKSKEPTLAQLKVTLREVRSQEKQTREHWAKQRNEMTDGRKASITAALSTRKKAEKVIEDAAEAERLPHKERYDQLRTSANEEYENTVKAAKEKLEKTLEDAKQAKQDAYFQIQEKITSQAAPLIETYRKDLAEVEDDFKKEMATINDHEDKALKELSEQIKTLELAIEKAAEAQTKKPKTEQSGAAAQ